MFVFCVYQEILVTENLNSRKNSSWVQFIHFSKPLDIPSLIYWTCYICATFSELEALIVRWNRRGHSPRLLTLRQLLTCFSRFVSTTTQSPFTTWQDVPRYNTWRLRFQSWFAFPDSNRLSTIPRSANQEEGPKPHSAGAATESETGPLQQERRICSRYIYARSNWFQLVQPS